MLCLSLILLLSLLSTPTTAESTITESTVTVTANADPPNPTSSTFTSPTLFITSLLNSTNTYRYQHASPAVIWNTTLAHIAQSYSTQCFFTHSHILNLGENLAEGYPSTLSAVDAWGNERSLYNFNTPTGFSEQTGHFTQLVWESTTSVGCGVTNCTGSGGTAFGWFLVCNYYPAGNIIGFGTSRNEFFTQNVKSQVHVGQMPSGWEEIATAASTSTVAAIGTGTTGGVQVTPMSSSPTATITVGIQSGSGNIAMKAGSVSSRGWEVWIWTFGVGFAAVVSAIGIF